MPTVKNQPPEMIYLQCYDRDGDLLDFASDDATWCRDRINDNDAVYVLATPGLVGLLERLGAFVNHRYSWYGDGNSDDARVVRALAARIKDSLG